MGDTDEGEESEGDDGVFAFSRPQTGKAPTSSAGGSVLSQSGRFSIQPSTSGGVLLADNTNRQSYNSSLQPSSSVTSSLPTFAYSASTPTPNRPSTAVSSSSPLKQGRIRSTTNDTYDSRDYHSSFKEEEDLPKSDRDHDRGIPLRSFTSLVPEPMMRSDGGTGSVSGSGSGGGGRDSKLWTNRRKSREGGEGELDQSRRGSRRISSLGGTETIPDGAQTREVGRLSGQTMDDYEK